jgi:hydroxymethylpyrimidine/phosphomethylpyrimidine kinase
MLANAPIVTAVVAELAAMPGVPVVVDPVMVATSGDVLLAPEAVAALRDELLPLAALVTPNLPEAAVLLGTTQATCEEEIAEQAKAIARLGSRAALIKGGHGDGAEAVDIWIDGARVVRMAAPRIDTPHTHGTGCTLSAAIAALLASGEALEPAVRRAKAYVSAALAAGRDLRVGAGRGPVDHLYALRRQPPPT